MALQQSRKVRWKVERVRVGSTSDPYGSWYRSGYRSFFDRSFLYRSVISRRQSRCTIELTLRLLARFVLPAEEFEWFESWSRAGSMRQYLLPVFKAWVSNAITDHDAINTIGNAGSNWFEWNRIIIIHITEQMDFSLKSSLPNSNCSRFKASKSPNRLEPFKFEISRNELNKSIEWI